MFNKYQEKCINMINIPGNLSQGHILEIFKDEISKLHGNMDNYKEIILTDYDLLNMFPQFDPELILDYQFPCQCRAGTVYKNLPEEV